MLHTAKPVVRSGAVLEDVTQSPQNKTKLKDFLQECEWHSEFKYLSIDATRMMTAIGLINFLQFLDIRMLWWVCGIRSKSRKRLPMA